MSTSDSNPCRLVLLLSNARDEPGFDDQRSLLAMMDEGGLLSSSVGICKARDLQQSSIAAPAACARSDWGLGAGWDLRDLLNATQIDEAVIVSIRDQEMNDWRVESDARRAIQDRLPTVLLAATRWLTVSPPDSRTVSNIDALSAEWDNHLICDRRAHPSSSTPLTLLNDTQQAAQQSLLVGLSAAGGLMDHEPVPLEADHNDGGVMPVRFAHASVRVVYGPSRIQFIPSHPPWPLPEGGGCEQAAAGTIPGLTLTTEAEQMMGFVCRPALLPEEPTPTRRQRLQRWKMWGDVPYATKRSPEEKAFVEFLRALGETDPEQKLDDARRGQSNIQEHCEALIEEHGVEYVGDTMIRAQFPTNDEAAAEAERSTPEVWRDLYGLCAALVDGGPLPGGVNRPEGPALEGATPPRIVWLDTDGIVPTRDALSRKVDGSYRKVAAVSGDAGTDGSLVDADEPPSIAETNNPEEGSETKPEPAPVLTMSLMTRLGDKLDGALVEASHKFCEHAFVHEDRREKRESALAARREARKAAIATGAVVFVALAFLVDQRWPYVNAIWSGIFGGSAPLRFYRPSTTPWVAMLVFAVVTLIAGITLFVFWLRSQSSILALEEANARRHRNNQLILHYVSEFLRLRLMVRQFTDHQQVISELLHSPFGFVAPPAAIPEPDIDWYTPRVLPPGLLLGAASPAINIDDTEQERLKKVYHTGWISDLLAAGRADWEDTYQTRITSGFEHPEQDTSPTHTVHHQNRQDGSDVLGARPDWLQFVQSGRFADSARLWVEKEWRRSGVGSAGAYGDHLTDIRFRSDHVGWWTSASGCLSDMVQQHDFDLTGVVLADATHPQPELSAAEPQQITVSRTVDGTETELIVLCQWEVLTTGPVPAAHLQHLHDAPLHDAPCEIKEDTG